MAHILDNPVWNALNSGNQNLAHGRDRAKFFAQDVSPFVGLQDNTPQDSSILYDLLPDERLCGVVSPLKIEVLPSWKMVQQMNVLQMVMEKPLALPTIQQPISSLSTQHIPAMLALTQLTNPGPFFSNTIAFGHYEGIFNGDELVAMAGQRLHAGSYAEISAVCTHPSHLGKGYARQLMLHQIHRIQAASDIPFLHVRTDNVSAISLYQALGFVSRRELTIYIIQKS